MGYDIRSFGVGGPVNEILVNRGDRGQVGTDVGRLSKALIADSMMCGDPNNKISSNCNNVMLYTERLTAKYIGSIVSNSNGNKQLSHFSNVPVYLDQYADCAGLVISLISEMAVSAKFLDETDVKTINADLKNILKRVWVFNLMINGLISNETKSNNSQTPQKK